MAIKKVLSIEIGYSLTKVLEIDYNSKNPKVYSSFVLETPTGFFADDIIGDFPEFSKKFRETLDAMGIKTKNAVFTISSPKIASREVPIPSNVKDNKIQKLVDMNARDYFPIDLAEYKLSYTILRNEVKEGMENRKYLLVLAAPKNILESYIRFGRTCGLETVALDYSGNSLYQAVRDNLVTDEVKMFIKIEEKNSFCMVTKGEDVIFTRNLTYGIDEAIEAIIDDKSFEDTNTYLNAMNYARAKTCIYSSYNHEGAGLGEAVGDSQILYNSKCIVTDSFKFLTGGIARVIDFFKSKNPDENISTIYLTGMGADFSGLQKLINFETGYDCKVYTHFDTVRFDKAKELPLCEYITCVGAAKKSVAFISGDSDEEQEKKAKQSYSASTFFVFFLCVLASVAIVGFYWWQLNLEKERKANLESQYNTYSQALEHYTNYLNALASYEKAQYYLSEADNNLDKIVEFINEMETKMPKSMRVQSFSASNDGVNLSVTVDSKEAVAVLITKFETFEMVESVNVTSFTISQNEAGEEVCAFAAEVIFKGNKLEVVEEYEEQIETEEETDFEE